MGMEHITGTAYGLVMRQGIAAGRAGNTGRHGRIARTAGTGAASVKGPDPKARPVYREEVVVTAQEPSSSREEARPVLRVVFDNSRCMPLRDHTRSAQRCSGIHLVLA